MYVMSYCCDICSCAGHIYYSLTMSMQKGSFLLEKHYITLITSGMYLLQQAASLDFLRVYKGGNFRFRSQTCEIVVDDELLYISWTRHGFFFASIQIIILSNILVNSKMRKKYLTKIVIVILSHIWDDKPHKLHRLQYVVLQPKYS